MTIPHKNKQTKRLDLTDTQTDRQTDKMTIPHKNKQTKRLNLTDTQTDKMAGSHSIGCTRAFSSKLCF